MSEEPKKIEVVNGDGKELEISPVYEHLSVAKPKMKEDKKIVVPVVKKKEQDKEKEQKKEDPQD